VYAGFPLGKDLWDFLVDHCGGLELAAMEAISAYFSTLDPSQRREKVKNLELVLTKLERGEIAPMPAKARSASTKSDWNLAEKRALKLSMRHTFKNDQEFDFDAYWESVRGRRESSVSMWASEGASLGDLREVFVSAFLLHHTCIRFGRRHFSGGDERPPPLGIWPADFSESCPCRKRMRIGAMHRTFDGIARMFHSGDTIVTFNYDATVEMSLWLGQKWNFANGYGFPVNVTYLEAARLKDADRLRRPSPVKVLKPHGSVNWQKSTSDGRIGVSYLGLLFDVPRFSTYEPSPDYEEYAEETEFIENTLVAPTYLKDYRSEPTLKIIWDQIEAELRSAGEITVAGYSLPQGDASARQRIASALCQNEKCKSVKIVSPSDPKDGEWGPFLDTVKKRCNWECNTFEGWVLRGR